MTYTLIISPEAEKDIEAAFEWYNRQSSQLGSEFVREVDRSLSQIQQFPESNAIIYKNTRRKLLKRFPYGIFYVLESATIVTIACFHARQEPESWEQRSP